MNQHHAKRSNRPQVPVSRSLLSTGVITANDLSSKSGLMKAVARIPFGWQLDAITVPSGTDESKGKRPAARHDLLASSTNAESDGKFYVCRHVNLGDLLVPEFMNEYVRKGSLIALSMDGAEGDDVVCIDGRGRLVLNVSKDTYEVLGLPGRASAFGALKQRFIIEISIVDPSFRAGKKGFERVKACLTSWPTRAKTDALDELAGLTGLADGRGEASQSSRTFDLLMAYVDDKGHSAPIHFPPPTAHTPDQRPLMHQSHPQLNMSEHQSLASIRVPSGATLAGLIEKKRRQRQADGSEAPSRKKRKLNSALQVDEDDDGDDLAYALAGIREWAGLVALSAPDDEGGGQGAGDKLRIETGAEDEDREIDEWAAGIEIGGGCVSGEAQFWSWTGFFRPEEVVLKLLIELIGDDKAREDHSPPSIVHFSLHPPPHSPLSHLSSNPGPQPSTSRRSKSSGGRQVKRGRGRGEEEESRGIGGGEGTTSALEVVMCPLPGEGHEEGSVIGRQWVWACISSDT